MPSNRPIDRMISLYESRAKEYDNSWHTDFTKRFISLLKIQPGQHVLDLACGTGLLSFLEADIVGPAGQVVGVDATPGMLKIAADTKTQAGDKYFNVTLLEGDISNLEAYPQLKGNMFDIITIASALAWFADPVAAIKHWKPGGIIAVDIPHPRNILSSIVLERVALRLNLPTPWNRSWSRTRDSLKTVLESAGLEVEQVTTVNNQAGYGRRFLDVKQWHDSFVQDVLVNDIAKRFPDSDVREQAERIYGEEWEKLAIDGKVEEVDAVFVGVGRKPAEGAIPKTVKKRGGFSGGCRCGGVQYTSSEGPSEITACHCRACQQLSGSAFLPFVDASIAAVQFTEVGTRKSLRLSDVAERTFCSACGTPISMAYAFDPDMISFTMATVDLSSLSSGVPKVTKHIFLRERAAWMPMPDDGAELWGTWDRAHLLAVGADKCVG